MKLKAMTWNLMYIGAILCAIICVAMVYKITTTQDTTDEWIIWTCVIIGFSLFGFGFVYEGRNKDTTSEPKELSKEIG
jgi:NADH:ubiquinone oxidoreductase subunit 6 (subunit J)